VWEELAVQLKVTHPHVMVAKIDFTANEVALAGTGAEVTGFPTVYLFPRKSASSKHSKTQRKPVLYVPKGSRDLASLVQFVQQHVQEPESVNFIRQEL
jgi:hypothetical protein